MKNLFKGRMLPYVSLLVILLVSCGGTYELKRTEFLPLGNDIVRGDYRSIDRHALAAQPGDETSVKTLAAYLASGAQNDEEKARAAFRWLTGRIAYDTKGFRRGSYGDLSPRGVLKSRVAVCQGYADLFVALTRAMGLESVTISGYGKGYGYSAGDPINETNHAWNAVRIDGQWRLVDATWGAGHVDKDFNFVRSLDEFNFLASPAAFIFRHLPSNPKWQLLQDPVSSEEFGAMVELKSGFFIYDMRLKSHYASQIEAEDTLAIEMYVPMSVKLLPSLKRKGKNVGRSRMYVQRDGDLAVINLAFPKKGEYHLDVFAGRPKEHDKTVSSFEHAMSYEIRAHKSTRMTFPVSYCSNVDASLISPLEGHIPKGEFVDVMIKVPGARSVTVSGGRYVRLDAQGELFSGRYQSDGKPFIICAEFVKGDSSECLYGFNQKEI